MSSDVRMYGHEVRPRTRGPARLSAVICLLFFGTLLGWSWFVPLERAVLASGVVVIEGSRRQVQHLEGGIVGKILVKEGSVVTAGEMVMKLDDTLSSTQVDLLQSQRAASAAQVARLRAEVDGSDVPDYADWLVRSSHQSADVGKTVESQTRLFEKRREALRTSVSLLDERNGQAQKEISGLDAEIASQDRQLKLITQELNAVQQLVARGLERSPRALLLERQQAEIEGARGQNLARIARAELTINENKLKQVDLRNQFRADAAQKLLDEENRLSDSTDKLKVAEDTLKRAALRAPVSGKVFNLRAFTEGGVINAREPVMEIVSLTERLVVDAHVSPNDIDAVKRDARVNVRFSSLSNRQAVVTGVVSDFAADRQTDNRTGSAYFTARVMVEPAEFEHLGVPAFPGMPVEVTILAGSRSLLNYLLEPFFNWYSRALREK